jgi:hypothetical protein
MRHDPLPAIIEADAPSAIEAIFADIRGTLGVSVVNLIWRHLATIPGALEWAWASVKPLYVGHGPIHATQVLQHLPLPNVPGISQDTMLSAGVDLAQSSSIRSILDSYHHTNALALVCLSAFCARFGSDESPSSRSVSTTYSHGSASLHREALPPLPSMQDPAPAVRGLIYELNTFGEDSDPELVASMYRHLSYWPAYLSLIRTLLVRST